MDQEARNEKPVEGTQQLGDLFDQIAVGIFLIDSCLTILDANTEARRLLGYTLEELQDLQEGDLLHPEDLAQQSPRQAFEELLKGERMNLERRYRCRNGAFLPVQVNLILLNNEAETYLAVFQDLSRCKHMEQAFQESERRYRRLAENMTDLIWTAELASDGTLSCTYISPSVHRMLGYTPEEFVEKPIHEYLTPESYSKVRDLIRHRLASEDSGHRYNGPVRFEVEQIRKDGSTLWTEIITTPLRDEAGSFCGVHGVTRDISEFKRTEQALVQSKERYRAILESIGEGYFEVDLQGNILFFNEALSAILGYPRKELYGLNYRELSPPKTAQRLKETFNRMHRTGKPARLSDYRIYTASGAEKTLEISAYPMEGYGGNIEGFRGVVRDVTERRRIEEEKAQLEHQLRQAQRLEAVGTLAAGVAHEFNNLLQGVYGSIQLLLFKKSSGDPECKHLHNIEKLVERGKEVVSGLLTFSRKQQLKFEAVDANKIVEETLSFLRNTLPKSVSLRLDLSRDTPYILADPIQLEQILVNLINNAEHALASAHGGEITIATRSYTRRPNDLYPDLAPGSYFRLAVRDNGPGMTKEQLDHIFDPFYTTKEPGEGTGLGLSTIYNIVKGHNGHIQCSSQPGEGTEFIIDLPALQLGADASAGPEEPRSAASLCRGRETVLLVEDETAIREFLHELLQSCGYKVLLAASGEEALTLEAEYEKAIDLILLDLGMPGMSGEQFLKERPQVEGRKIILISGYDANRINKALTEFHIDGAVRKPFHLESFLATIRNVLDAS